MNCFTEHDSRDLMRLGRYLITYPERVGNMHRSVPSEAGVVRLDTNSNTDSTQNNVMHNIGTCLHVLPNDCLLSSVVRRQSFIVISSAGVEFGGLNTAVISTFPLDMFLEWLGFKAWVRRLGHLDTRLLRTQAAIVIDLHGFTSPKSVEVCPTTRDGGGLVSLRAVMALLRAALVREIGGSENPRKHKECLV